MNKFRRTLPPLATLLPFEASARLGSITKAGEELGLTQAAISRQIKALETNLGIKLFLRRNRAIHLTEDGKEFQHAVTSALETVATNATRLREQNKTREVILFAQLCEGLYWVMPRLSKFYQQHPNIEVRVPVSTRPLTESVEYFDFALQTSGRKSGQCEVVFTVPDQVFPVCSSDYCKNSQIPMTLENLGEHHLLHHRIHPQDWINWDDWLQQLGSETRVGFGGTIFDSYPMMIQSAIEGHGIALGWKQTTDQLIASGALVKPFSESLHLPDGLSVYRHPQCVMNQQMETFLGWLQEELLGDGV